MRDDLPFRWLVSGTTVNLLGSGIAPVALAFAVLDLGGGAAELGLVVGLYALADVAAVLFGGVLGDRLPRTVMLQGTSAAAAAVQGVVALSLIAGWSSIPLLAVLGMVNGSLSALGSPSSSAITQQTVPTPLLQRAISWRRISQNVAMIVGNGVAGLLVVWVGSGWALAVDAGTFALAAACFTRVRVPAVAAPGAQAGLWSDVAAGFREVVRHTWLWLLILPGAALPPVLRRRAERARPDRRRRRPRPPGLGLGAVDHDDRLRDRRAGHPALAAPSRPVRRHLLPHPDRGVPPGHGVVGLAGRPAPRRLAARLRPGILSVGWDLSIQQQVAPDMLARVYSFDMIGSFIARPVGLALTGPLSTLVGFRTWLTVVGAVIVGSTLAALASRDVRRLERRDDARVDAGVDACRVFQPSSPCRSERSASTSSASVPR